MHVLLIEYFECYHGDKLVEHHGKKITSFVHFNIFFSYFTCCRTKLAVLRIIFKQEILSMVMYPGAYSRRTPGLPHPSHFLKKKTFRPIFCQQLISLFK